MASITRQIQIIGNKEITNMERTDVFTIVGKAERVFNNVLDTDGALSVPITNLGTISKIIVESTDAILRINDGVNDTDIPVSGLLMWDVSPAFAATITSVSVLTTSTAGVDIEISVLGV